MESELSWHESAPGIYHRGYDPVDKFYQMVMPIGMETGRQYGVITSAVKLEFDRSDDFINAVQKAWISIRYNQPNIASHFEIDKNFWTYESLSVESLQSWLDETFRIENSLSLEQLLATLKSLKRPTLFVIPRSHELVLRTPHPHIDGVGVLGLWHDILSAISKPNLSTSTDEAKNLSPSFTFALKLVPVTEEIKLKAHKRTAEYWENQPSVALPFTLSGPGAQTRFRSTFFTPVQSAKIITAAKARGFTTTQVVQTAVIVTTARLCTNPAAQIYNSITSINLRRICKEEFQKFNVSTYFLSWQTIIKPSDFATTAAKVKDFYLETSDEVDNGCPGLIPWASELVEQLGKHVDKGAPPSETTVSSFGIIEKKIQRKYDGFKVRDFYFGTDILSPLMTVYPFTWRDELRLVTSYNVAFRSEEQIEEFDQVLLDALLDGLGLDKTEFTNLRIHAWNTG